MRLLYLILLLFILPLASFSQNCSDTLFLKSFYRNLAVFANDFVVTPNNEMIVGGYWYKGSGQDMNDILLTKISSTGVKIWEKTFGRDDTQNIRRMLKLSDGNFMAIGEDFIGAGMSLFLMKFNTNGEIIWRRSYQHGFLVDFPILKAVEGDDGSIYTTGFFTETASFTERVAFMKFTATGDLVYVKSFKPPGSINLVETEDLIIRGGYSYLAGTYAGWTSYLGLMMKVRNSDGNLEWTRSYNFNNGAAVFTQLLPFDNDKFCLLGNDNSNASDTSLVYIIDTTGNVISSKYLRWPGARRGGKAVIDNSGTLVWYNSNYNYNPTLADYRVTRLHPINGVIWAKQFPQIKKNPRFNQVAYGMDSSVFFLGENNSSIQTWQIFAGRSLKDGVAACTGIAVPYTFGTGNSNSILESFTSSNKQMTEINPAWEERGPVLMYTDTFCLVQNNCSSIVMSAPLTSCVNDTLHIDLAKNCMSFPVLDYSSNMQLLSSTDTSIRFLLTAPGDARVISRIQTSCALITDTLNLTVYSSPGSFSLGPDKFICQGNNIALQGPLGYRNYLWNTGSQDSSIFVTSPGNYILTVTDSCGKVFMDSVMVSAYVPPAFNAGADKNICQGDSVVMNATDGFNNYQWTNNLSSQILNAQQITVSPVVNTSFFVAAESLPGCFVFDTVAISVISVPSINLGADTSLCSGQKILLDAGPGFISYLWEDGSTAQSKEAGLQGNYYVKATMAEGCVSRDTLVVQNIWALPMADLDNKNYLCEGETRMLNAGTFSSYLWHDGSTSGNFLVSNTGIYSVRVTDNKNCSGVDSVVISSIVPRPSNFLPPDTSICSYASMNISVAGNFNSYSWNNGNITNSITITTPGIYWLDVTDMNQCKGRDSLEVQPQDCMRGIYIPNAFTPGKDGKNDVFRALAFGNLKQFKLQIFNRWGERIFETSDIQRGWNGKTGSVDNGTHVFVWLCTYRFDGEETKTLRGTVTLVR